MIIIHIFYKHYTFLKYHKFPTQIPLIFSLIVLKLFLHFYIFQLLIFQQILLKLYIRNLLNLQLLLLY
ncbi:hypothetical protein YN1_7290 [Nanoarchaeota archaeon]